MLLESDRVGALLLVLWQFTSHSYNWAVQLASVGAVGFCAGIAFAELKDSHLICSSLFAAGGFGVQLRLGRDMGGLVVVVLILFASRFFLLFSTISDWNGIAGRDSRLSCRWCVSKRAVASLLRGFECTGAVLYRNRFILSL